MGQDLLLDRYIFKGARSGIFVDVGAHDGISFSNSYFLERHRGWTGLLIEPNPEVFVRLVSQRDSYALNVAAGQHPGYARFTKLTGYSEMLSGLTKYYNSAHRERISRELEAYGGSRETIEVPVASLQQLIARDPINLPYVDVLMIDTEGSELDVLLGLDLASIQVKCVMLENNYGSQEISAHLAACGYRRCVSIGQDELYLRDDLGPT